MFLPLIMMLAAASDSATPAAPKLDASQVEEQGLKQLLTVRRVYIDRLSGGDTATQMRDMLASSLQNSRLFVITENQERADAVLRGSAEDLVFTEEHNTSDSLHAQANFGGGSTTGSTGSSGSRRSGYNTRDQRNRYQGINVGDSESSRIAERKHEAVAAVRLVNKDGDVIWSTTQESMGGKFRGSSADVADKITKKLLEDYETARKIAK